MIFFYIFHTSDTSSWGLCCMVTTRAAMDECSTVSPMWNVCKKNREVATIFVREVVRMLQTPLFHEHILDWIILCGWYSSTYPQTDSQSEAVNKCLETYLRCFTGSKSKQWPKWLAWAKYWYNTNYHKAIQMTPFQALYGRDPPTLIRGGWESTVVEVQTLMEEQNHMLDELKFQLERA